MPKKKKKKFWIYRDFEYKSKEEMEFAMWLAEAQRIEVVKSAEYEPKTFILSPKQQTPAGKFLLHKQTYTPDWGIQFTEKFNQLDHGLYLVDNFAYVDIKGTFSRNFVVSSNYTFPIVQKWLFHQENIYINKIIARNIASGRGENKKVSRVGFFEKTWVPRECAFNQRMLDKPRNEAFINCKLLEEVKFDGLF